ncbi:MAG: hypothetical protein E6J26_05930 [Chloroflexi bacterium]|nr:MAG: hypothetical protein E6J26_05930 [Chloroflexota bacterium]
MRSVVGLFDDFGQAQQAVREMLAMGIKQDDISLVANDVAGRYKTSPDAGEAGKRLTGTGTGAVLGGAAGLLVGLTALVIPGIGPVIAAGQLGAALATGLISTSVGAVAGGVLGALADLGMTQEDANYYVEAVRRGGTLVTVGADDQLTPRVEDLLRRHGAIDIKQRAAIWRQSGWKGFDPEAKPYTADELSRERELIRKPHA